MWFARAPGSYNARAIIASILALNLALDFAARPAFAQSAGTYVVQPTTGGSTNTVGPATSAIAIGVNANASSPNGSGDSIAIGTDVNASNTDSVALGAQTTASGINSFAIGNGVFGIGGTFGTTASGANSIVFGANANTTGADSIAIGNASTATQTGGVALGFGAVALRPSLGATPEAFSGTTVASPYGAVSVGSAGDERQITNVAGGTQATDAVNLRQLQAVANDLAGTTGGSFDATTGAYTAPSYTFAGTPYASLTNTIAAINNLTVQYTPNGGGAATNVIDLTKGGALAPVSVTGLAPATTSTGAVSLSQLPVQYSTAAAPRTANPAVPSNDVTLIGTGGQPVTLHNVAAGAINASSTDAVNGSQVYNTAASVAQALGGGSTVNANGTISAPSYTVQGATYTNVGGAIGGLNTAITNINTNGTPNLAINAPVVAPASATGTNAVALGPNASASSNGGVALGANSVALRPGLSGAKEAFSGVAVASTAGAVSVGSVGGERQITNVAGGTAPTDAVNVRQLSAVGNNLATALGGGAAFCDCGSFQAPAYKINGTTYNNVGSALNALNNPVQYDVVPATGARANSITLAGGDPNQPVLIKNVATGQAATDAANTGQVAAAQSAAFAYTNTQVAAGTATAKAYTDKNIAGVESQIGGLSGQIADLQSQVGGARIEARQAAAVGLAAASLRFDNEPGKISASVGTGVWKGQAAGALGVGYSLPDGWARVNATGVTTGRDFGMAAGASFTLN